METIAAERTEKGLKKKQISSLYNVVLVSGVEQDAYFKSIRLTWINRCPSMSTAA
jgi:hypothetical protein